MSKRVLEPNTTLYPVALIFVTVGGDTPYDFSAADLRRAIQASQKHITAD